MSLPKITLPTYEVYLPLSKQKIVFRPFTTKEQKVLLMATEGGDEAELMLATKQILTNCILTPDINIEVLPLIDIEYLFLKLRSKSVGEVIEARYICENEVDGKKCGTLVTIPIDLNKIEPTLPEKDYSVVKLSPTMGMKLRYPRLNSYGSTINKDVKSFQQALEIMASCVECVYDGDEVYDRFTHDEIVEFIEGLMQDQFEKLTDFFEHLPEIRVNIQFKCPKCKNEEDIVIEGSSELLPFFD